MKTIHFNIITVFLFSMLITGCSELNYRDYHHKFRINLNSAINDTVFHFPVIIEYQEIIQKHPDFNPFNYELVISEQDNFVQVPSQIDDLDGDGVPDELVFSISLSPDRNLDLYCFYNTEGKNNIEYENKTDAFSDWTVRKREIGWESNLAGFCFFDGRMDYYAKRKESLQLRRFGKETNYHQLNDWGMDVLVIGNKSGLGSISIWEEDSLIRTVGEASITGICFTKEVISTGPVRSMVKVTMDSIFSDSNNYRISMIMSAFADNRFSRQDVTIYSDNELPIVYSPGIQKLKDEIPFTSTKKGILSTWGKMDDKIGDIGLAIFFNSESLEALEENDMDHFAKLVTSSGELQSYYTMGGWHMECEPALSREQWEMELQSIQKILNADVQFEIK